MPKATILGAGPRMACVEARMACVEGGSGSVEVDATEVLTSCEAGNVLEDPSMHAKGIDPDPDCL